MTNIGEAHEGFMGGRCCSSPADRQVQKRGWAEKGTESWREKDGDKREPTYPEPYPQLAN